MNYTEFVIRYTKAHPEMDERQLVEAVAVAWQRNQNQPTGDILQWWMADTQMELDFKRAMRRLV